MSLLQIESLTPNTHQRAKEIIVKGLKERFGEENFDESFNPDLNQLQEAFLYFCVGFVHSKDLDTTTTTEERLLNRTDITTNNNNNQLIMIATGGLSLDFNYFGNENQYCFRIERVSVLKEFRRRGYASQIISHLMNVAKQIAVPTIEPTMRDESSSSRVLKKVCEKIETLLQPHKLLVRKIVVETDTPWMESVELYKKMGFMEICEKEGCTHFELDF
ncbi:hypothetical protein FDP41_008454 [Naegleria fowleri]|uniref:N-acetyltransferase domain-containing protein n=1 Tax=Naegleria fowleri TaxID=5763 RepID=A0A6A5B6D2_NAEFO|nr:uncharacterized protein FDP41_008454 [Naegleria fowleri]KAF0973247.1 hypothetical protein FDP41_008454 [Naegleria fowleri]